MVPTTASLRRQQAAYEDTKKRFGRELRSVLPPGWGKRGNVKVKHRPSTNIGLASGISASPGYTTNPKANQKFSEEGRVSAVQLGAGV